MLTLAVLAAVGWRHRATRPDHRLQTGTEALRQQDWDAVREIVTRLEASGATDHAAVLNGELLAARRLHAEALNSFTAVQTEGPLRVRAALGSARCLLALGNVHEADLAFSYVVQLQPDSVDAHRGLASIAYDLGQLSKAVSHLERVAELDPTDARPHRLIGLINKDLNQGEEAEAAYREAIRRGLSPAAKAEVAQELAEALVQERKYAEALAALDDAGPAATNGPEFASIRIEALRGTGDRDRAFALADRMVATSANDGPFHRLRGQLNVDKGDTAAAVADLEQAALRTPHHYQTRLLLAQAYAVAGRTADADRENATAKQLRADLELATALTREAMDKPWDPVVRKKLADVSERMGDAKLAAMWRAAAAACTRLPQ